MKTVKRLSPALSMTAAVIAGAGLGHLLWGNAQAATRDRLSEAARIEERIEATWAGVTIEDGMLIFRPDLDPERYGSGASEECAAFSLTGESGEVDARLSLEMAFLFCPDMRLSAARMEP